MYAAIAVFASVFAASHPAWGPAMRLKPEMGFIRLNCGFMFFVAR